MGSNNAMDIAVLVAETLGNDFGGIRGGRRPVRGSCSAMCLFNTIIVLRKN